MIHTVESFSAVNEAEVDFPPMEFFCFFYDLMDIDNLISRFHISEKGKDLKRKWDTYTWGHLQYYLKDTI